MPLAEPRADRSIAVAVPVSSMLGAGKRESCAKFSLTPAVNA
jgi:hypothetical protein